MIAFMVGQCAIVGLGVMARVRIMQMWAVSFAVVKSRCSMSWYFHGKGEWLLVSAAALFCYLEILEDWHNHCC
jgi:hypothetical protein